MLIIALTFSVAVANSCRYSGIEAYTSWYDQLAVYADNSGQNRITIKEYPRELGWITYFGTDKLTVEKLDTLYDTPDEHVQFVFTAEDTTSNTKPSPLPAFDRYRFNIAETVPLDVRPLSSGAKTEKYLVVFNRLPDLEKRHLSISGPDGMAVSIPLEKIIIKNKRKLRI